MGGLPRQLMAWGSRVDRPQYDGDILLLPQQSWAFAVTWQTGILYVNRMSEKTVVYGPTVSDVPLLPYEKELIKTIGITEEEYRRFAAEVDAEDWCVQLNMTIFLTYGMK